VEIIDKRQLKEDEYPEKETNLKEDSEEEDGDEEDEEDGEEEEGDEGDEGSASSEAESHDRNLAEA